MLYPTVVFGTCFFLNFFLLGKKSSGAVSKIGYALFFCTLFPFLPPAGNFAALSRLSSFKSPSLKSGSVCNDGGAVVHVDGHLVAVGLHWLLLWFAETSMMPSNCQFGSCMVASHITIVWLAEKNWSSMFQDMRTTNWVPCNWNIKEMTYRVNRWFRTSLELNILFGCAFVILRTFIFAAIRKSSSDEPNTTPGTWPNVVPQSLCGVSRSRSLYDETAVI